MITGKGRTKRFIKIDSHESQIKELTHSIVAYIKSQKPQASPKVDENPSFCDHSHASRTQNPQSWPNPVTEPPPCPSASMSPVYPTYPRIIHAWPKAFRPTSFPPNHNNCRKSKGYLGKTKGEDRVFTFLLENLSLMFKKILKDNPIVPKLRRQEFDPHANCLYHMDMSEYIIEGCWPLKHKIQHLRDACVIIIDLLNWNEIGYRSKDH